MSKTLSDLRAKCYDILREEENSSAYPYSLVDDLINTAQQKICSGLVINPLNGMEVHKGQLPFLNKEVFYNVAPMKYLASDVNIMDTNINVGNTNGLPSIGYVYIDGNIIKYDDITTTTLVDCSGILSNIKAGKQVSLVYELPNDFMSPVNVVLNDKLQIFNEDYDDVFEGLRDWKGVQDYRYERYRGYGKPFYAIKDFSYLVLYNVNVGGGKLRLRYESMPTPMVDANDVCVINNDVYAMSVIPYLAVGETMYNRGEESRGAEVINFGMGQLREMYQFYNKTGIERMTSKNYKMGKSSLNI